MTDNLTSLLRLARDLPEKPRCLLATELVRSFRSDSTKVGVFIGDSASRIGAEPLFQVCAAIRGIDCEPIGPSDIVQGALFRFEAVMFPGGSGSAQARSLTVEGCQRIREYVGSGGGFVGICGGAYLSTLQYSWSLGILNAQVLTSNLDPESDSRNGLWYRGGPQTVNIQLTSAGKIAFMTNSNNLIGVRFHNGPILLPGHSNDLAPFEVLAHYRSEICRIEEQRGTMVNTPAIVLTSFGAGRVMAIGPHFEADISNHLFLSAAIRLICGKI